VLYDDSRSVMQFDILLYRAKCMHAHIAQMYILQYVSMYINMVSTCTLLARAAAAFFVDSCNVSIYHM
jgi:hypothetical protein